MTNLLQIDPSAFRASFGTSPLPIRHALADHPLLALDRIADLADRLPADQVEHNLGTIPDVLPGGEAPRLDASPGEIARGIHSNGCWMVLKHIETDDEYRALLHEALAEVAPLTAGLEGPMRRRQAFLFLSAPGSVTPAHVDPEHNFLLQISGTKTMVTGSFADPDAEQRELERQNSGAHRNMAAMFDAPHEYPMASGDGLYVPVYAPHLVRNGPEPSVSLSITWRTPESDHVERLHVANARLRRAGLAPKAPGARPRADRAKVGVTRVVQAASARVKARRG
jgi:hypothetical protein